MKTWKAGNVYGYVIERYTIIRNNKQLPKAEKKILTVQPLKPLPMEAWRAAVQRNDYAAAFVSSLYDTSFELSNKQNAASSIVSKLTIAEQRYAVAMLSADMSFEAATMGALAFTDSTVQPGEKYLYRLVSKIPRNIIKTDTLAVFTGLSDYRALPKPDGILPVFSDRQVLLSWDYKRLEKYYSAYIIEKSADGGQTFTAVNERPVIPFSNTTNDSLGKISRIYYTDTLAQNDALVQYRIKGISPFGDESPYSDMVAGSGKTDVFASPGISSVVPLENDKIKIAWEIDRSAGSLLTGFSIGYAPAAEGPFTTIAENIPATIHEHTIETKGQSGYYTVSALTKYGTVKNSFPYLIQPEDSIPPAPVEGFAGAVDSNGVVTLRWKPNSEKDFGGYKLYKTIRQEDEYAVLTDTLYTRTEFKDTLSLKLLNSKVWYNIVALDTRANASKMIGPLQIDKPDKIPPMQPVFKNFEVGDKGIVLQWNRSNSDDVAAHYLLRKKEGAAAWDTLQTITEKYTQQYNDTSARAGVTYEYTLVAKDLAGLVSAPSPVLTLTAADSWDKQLVKKIAAVAGREQRLIAVSWEYDRKPFKQLELFRAEGKSGLSLYQVLENGELVFTDKDLKVNNKYTYAVRAVLPDGKYSEMKMVVVNY
jgi:uncharacterized protein